MDSKFSLQSLGQCLLCLTVSILLYHIQLFSTGRFILFPLSVFCLGIFFLLSVSPDLTKKYYRILKTIRIVLTCVFLIWGVLLVFTPQALPFAFIALLLAFTSCMPPGSSLLFGRDYLLALCGKPVYQEYIAECFVRGENVSKNAAEAFKWFKKAALKDHPEAQYYLGVFYEFGIGTEADLSEAMKWYWEAVQKGHPAATARINRPLIQKDARPPENLT